MAALSEGKVLSFSKKPNLEAVKTLNLWGQGFVDVSIFRRMPGVEELTLTRNKISSLEALSECTNLRTLLLRSNRVSDLAELSHLKTLAQLTDLWLRDNPCAKLPNYRLTVLRALPHLAKLDGEIVTEDERKLVMEMAPKPIIPPVATVSAPPIVAARSPAPGLPSKPPANKAMPLPPPAPMNEGATAGGRSSEKERPPRKRRKAAAKRPKPSAVLSPPPATPLLPAVNARTQENTVRAIQLLLPGLDTNHLMQVQEQLARVLTSQLRHA